MGLTPSSDPNLIFSGSKTEICSAKYSILLKLIMEAAVYTPCSKNTLMHNPIGKSQDISGRSLNSGV